MPIKKSASNNSIATSIVNTLRGKNLFGSETLYDEDGRTEIEWERLQEAERVANEKKAAKGKNSAIETRTLPQLQDRLVAAKSKVHRLEEKVEHPRFSKHAESAAQVEADFAEVAALKPKSEIAQKLSKSWLILGGTGNIGICLTEKLLRTTDAKLFLIVRKSTDRVAEGWDKLLSPARAAKLKAMLEGENKRVTLLLGDLDEPNLGLNEKQVKMLAAEVEFVATTVGDINLKKGIADLAQANITGSLHLAELCMRLPKLQRVLITSTAYVNAFLPEGAMAEEMCFSEEHAMHDPEAEYASIQRGEVPPAAVMNTFPWNYAYSKNLNERLLQVRYGVGKNNEIETPKLPLLFLRPPNVGPAVYEPHPGFSSFDATPVTNTLMALQSFPTIMYRQALAQHRKEACDITRGNAAEPEPHQFRLQLFAESSIKPRGTNTPHECPVDHCVSMFLVHAALGDKRRNVVNCTNMHATMPNLMQLTGSIVRRFRQSIAPKIVFSMLPESALRKLEKSHGFVMPQIGTLNTKDVYNDPRLCKTARLLKLGGLHFDFATESTAHLKATAMSAADTELFNLDYDFDYADYLAQRADLAFNRTMFLAEERRAKQAVEELRAEITKRSNNI